MVGESRVLLIGGTSHAGKSTLGRSLAAHLGWSYRSTDKLARHPGRPWRVPPEEVPPHVAEHYLSLPVEELIADVLRHYRHTVWPLAEALVTAHATDPSAERLILEGSAIWPDCVAASAFSNTTAVWLTASDALFEQRIYAESRYATRSAREKKMIDRFLERTWLYDERLVEAVERHGYVSLDVEAVPDLMGACLLELGVPASRRQAAG